MKQAGDAKYGGKLNKIAPKTASFLHPYFFLFLLLVNICEFYGPFKTVLRRKPLTQSPN